MHEGKLNCTGYVYHRCGIDIVEIHREPPMVYQLEQDFEIVNNLQDALALAIIFGRKWLPEKERKVQRVKHMVYIENIYGDCTHRNGNGSPIEQTSIDTMRNTYIDERGIYYFAFLRV